MTHLRLIIIVAVVALIAVMPVRVLAGNDELVKPIPVRSMDQYEQLVADEELLVVVFWNNDVNIALNKAKRLATDYEGIITVATVNCDKYSGICQKKSPAIFVPSYLLYEDGEKVAKYTGDAKWQEVADRLGLEDYVEYE